MADTKRERGFVCANPNCSSDLRYTTVTVSRKDLVQCGDHDEYPLTAAFICCSFACAALVTSDLAKERAIDTEAIF